ncbi:MAG TPA: hypothetical protein VLV84_02760 [Candidatus Acidoferrales bacterium]|nr:hypothetical protein [Candidatus Acidoferrales bacterium]
MVEEQRRMRRESGWLMMGVALGILGGIIGALYSAYYIEWIKDTYPKMNWGFAVLISSIVLAVLLAFLFLWSYYQIRRGTMRD